MKKKVLIQGVEGCYHDAAARAYFAGEGIDVVPCDTFGDMFDMLQSDASLLGIMAIENTIAGSSHVLAALPGQSMDGLTEVNSHPMALMQCGQFLSAHRNLKVVEKEDTAGSAKMIAENRLYGHAAICGKYAAGLYGLDVLAEGIETNKRNFTRFLILADPLSERELTSGKKIDKASLVFTLPHTQGSLAKILTIFSFYDINLSKIQSIPIIGREWEYRFFINLTFDDYVRYRQSIEAVKPLISDFKILGEYSKCD